MHLHDAIAVRGLERYRRIENRRTGSSHCMAAHKAVDKTPA